LKLDVSSWPLDDKVNAVLKIGKAPNMYA